MVSVLIVMLPNDGGSHAVSQQTSRIPANDRVRGDIFCDDGACCHNSAITNDDTRQNKDALTDPYVVSNRDRAGARHSLHSHRS